MSVLQLRGDYLNEYARARDLLSQKKDLFYEEDWEAMVKRGQDELDMWIGALSNPDVSYEKLNQIYDNKFDYLDSDYRRMAILNENMADKNKLAENAQIYQKDEKGNYMYDKLTGEPLMEKATEMTEYDYNKYLVQQNADYNMKQRELELAQKRKDELNDFVKIGADVAGALGEFGSGFMNQVQNIVGFLGAVGNVISAPFATGEWDPAKNFVDYIGSAGYKFWTKSGVDEALLDFERQYSGLRDVNGNFTYGGKILVGVANSIGQMLPSMLLCKIPSVGSIPGAGSSIFYAGVTAGSIGDVYKEFQTKNGLSVSEFTILSNATIKSVLQLGVELTLPKILGFGPSGLDSMMFGRTASSIAGKTLTNAGVKRLAQDFLEEGLEEVLQDTTDFLVDSFYYLFTKKDFGSISEYSFQNLVDSFIIGGLTSIAGSGFEILRTSRMTTGKVNFETDKNGKLIAKEEKLNKLASWEYGLDYESYMLNLKNIFEDIKNLDIDAFVDDEKSLNKFKAAITEVYASYRMISSLYSEIGDERIIKANELLKKASELNIDELSNKAFEVENAARVSLKALNDIDITLSERLKKQLDEKLKDAGISEVSNVASVSKDKVLTEGEKDVVNKAEKLVSALKDTNTNKPNKIQNVVSTKNGQDVVIDEKNKTVYAPEKMIDNLGVNGVLYRCAEKYLISEVKSGNFKGVNLTNILDKYKTYTDENDVTMDDAINALLFENNFFKDILKTANKDTLQFVETLVYEFKHLKIDNEEDISYKSVLNDRIKIMKQTLQDYYINTPLSIVDNRLFNATEIKNIHDKRWESDIFTRLSTIDIEDFTKTDKDFLETKINQTNNQELKNKYKTEGITFQNRDDLLAELNKETQNRYLGRYNGIIRFKPNTVAARQFNNYLDSIDASDIYSIFDTNQLSQEDLSSLQQNGIDIVEFRKQQFIQFTNNKLYFDYDDDNNVFLYTFKGDDLIDANVLSSNAFNTMSENYKQTVVSKRNSNLTKLLSKSLNNIDRNYLTITDVIGNAKLLDSKIRNDIIKQYGDDSEISTYYYLKNYFIKNYKTNILLNNDGDYVFTKYELAKDVFNNISVDKFNEMIKNKQTLDIKDFVKSKYLYGRLKDIKLIVSNLGKDVYGQYDIDSNTIMINSYNIDDSTLTTLIHEFQHAIQAENNLVNGNSYELLSLMSDTEARKLRLDIYKNLKNTAAFKGITEDDIIKGTASANSICNNFLYYNTGEIYASGFGVDNVINTYPVIVKDDVITLPWGSQFSLKSTNDIQRVKNTNVEFTLENPIRDDVEYKSEDMFRKLGFNTESPTIRRLYDLEYTEEDYGIQTDDNIKSANESHRYVVNNLSDELRDYMKYPIGESVYDNDMKVHVLKSITPELREQSLKYLYNQYFWYTGTYEEFLKTDIPIVRLTNNRNVSQAPFVSVTILSDMITMNNIDLKASEKGLNYSIIGYAKPSQFLMVLENNVMEALINPNNLYNTYTWNEDLTDATNTDISKSLYSLHNERNVAYSKVIDNDTNTQIELESIYEQMPILRDMDDASLRSSLTTRGVAQSYESLGSYVRHYIFKPNPQAETDFKSMDQESKNRFYKRIFENQYKDFINNLSRLKLIKRYLRFYGTDIKQETETKQNVEAEQVSKTKVETEVKEKPEVESKIKPRETVLYKQEEFKEKIKAEGLEKFPRNDTQFNKTVQLSAKKYKGTPIEKYMKPGERNEMDAGSVAFIMNATDKIDEELWNAVQSGTFYKQMAINFLVEHDEIDDATFELINNSYFGNEFIKTSKELDNTVIQSDKYYALLSMINHFESDILLEAALYDTNPDTIKGLDYLIANDITTRDIYTNIRERYNKRLEKEGKKQTALRKLLRYSYMVYFDKTIASAGYVSSLASKYLRTDRPGRFEGKESEISLETEYGKEGESKQKLEERLSTYANDVANDAISYITAKDPVEYKRKKLSIAFTLRYNNPELLNKYKKTYPERWKIEIANEISKFNSYIEKLSEQKLDEKLLLLNMATSLDIDMFVDNASIKIEQNVEKRKELEYAEDEIKKASNSILTAYKLANKIRAATKAVGKSTQFVTSVGNKRDEAINRLLEFEVKVGDKVYKGSDLFEKTDLRKKEKVSKNLTEKEEIKERLVRASYGVVRLKTGLLTTPGERITRAGQKERSIRYKSVEELTPIFEAISQFRDQVKRNAFYSKTTYKKYISDAINTKQIADKLLKNITNLGKNIDKPFKSLKQTYEVTVTPINIIVDKDTPLPNILQQLLQTEFVDYADTKVQYFSDLNEKHIKMNWELFVEKNIDMLNSLTQEDVDDFISFLGNTSLAIQGVDMQRYLNTLGYLVSYIVSKKKHNFTLTEEQRTFLNKYMSSTGSLAGQYLSNLRVFENLMNPEKVVAAAVANRCDIKLTNDETNELAKAIESNNGQRILEIRKNIIDNIINDPSRRGEVGRRSIWDKLLEWERMAMLSGPGTWIRNQVSNILVSAGNKTAEGMYKLVNNIFKFKQDKQVAGQYKIIGTKVTDEVKQYVADNIIESGMYDVIADGITKYDERKTSKLKDIDYADNLINMIKENVNHQVFSNKPNWKPLAKTYEFIMKMMSDDPSVKKAFISYIGKILTEEIENKNLNKNMLNDGIISSQIQKYIAEAYTMAAHDYMHKGNFWNDVEKKMRKRYGEGAFFAYKQIMPFASASWNWFMEAMNYTPAGLAVALRKFIKLDDSITKLEMAQQKGEKVFNVKFQQYLVKRNIGKGVIGSIGMILGMALAWFGLVDIDKDDNDEVKLKIDGTYIDISDVFGTSGLLLGMSLVSTFKGNSKNDSWASRLADALGTTFSNVFIDDSIESFYNTIRYFTAGDQRALLYYPYTTITKFIPNVMRTLSGVTKKYETIYSSNTFKKYGMKLLETIPGVSYLFPHYTDPYTGEAQTPYNAWIVTNVINKLSPIKLAPYKISNTEELALLLGVKKGNLTGRYTIGDNDIKLNTLEIEKLNMLYGKLNKTSLDRLTNNKQKYTVYDEKTNSYKELYFRNMTDKEKAAAIKQVMSKNSDYSKIYILTSTGKYKYYASDTEYNELRKLGITSNVYRKINNKEGFVKN